MLKAMKLRAELKKLKIEKDDLSIKFADYNKRSKECETALDEAETDEDIKTIEAELSELEKEKNENDYGKQLQDVDEKISKIQNELNEIEEKKPELGNDASEKGEEREAVKEMNKYQTREILRTGAYYEREEVKNFYGKLKNIRSIDGEGLTIPNVIVNRIMDIVGDYCNLYPLVDKIRVNGTARILLDTDTTPASWMENKAAIPEGNVGTITNVDFDGYKLGKLVFVDNYIIQDSIVNVDDYVTKKIGRALGLALNKAIPLGEGASKKQPTGIIPSLKSSNKVTVTSNKLADIVKPIGLIDTGKDSCGNITAVMKRQTYYTYLLEYTINVNSQGENVGKLPNLAKPDILGIPVIFNNFIPDGAILYGDFEKYTLVERENITIDRSNDVKFAEDQTAFRGKGRFDGKPTNADAFVLVTIGADASSETE